MNSLNWNLWGVYSRGPPILDLATHSSALWRSTLLWVYSIGSLLYWGSTLSGYRFWIWERTCLGVYSIGGLLYWGSTLLGVYSLGPPILDLATHSSTLWGSTLLGVYSTGGPHSGGLLSRATDFGSGPVLFYTLGVYSIGGLHD